MFYSENKGDETNLPSSFMEGQMHYVTFPWENRQAAASIQQEDAMVTGEALPKTDHFPDEDG